MSYAVDMDNYNTWTAARTKVALQYCNEFMEILNSHKCPCDNCEAGIDQASFDVSIRIFGDDELKVIICIIEQIMLMSKVRCIISYKKNKKAKPIKDADGLYHYIMSVTLIPMSDGCHKCESK